MAAADPEASLEAADTLLDLLNGERVSPEGAAEWVERGLEVLERNKEVGRGYFRLGSKYSLQVLEELKEGLALKSVARVLKLYATALSGHEIAIRGTNEMQAVDVFGVDHIILPPEMHFFEDDASNFTAYKVATAHGAGRIEFGTYQFSLGDIPETVENLAGPLLRGVPLSTLRPTVTDLTRFYEIFPQPALARDLFNIVEGHRVDAAIRRAYPGIRRDMAMIQGASAERRPDLASLSDAQAVVEGLLQHSLGMASDLSGLASATQTLIAEAIPMLAAVEGEDARVGDAATLTGALYALIDDGLANAGEQTMPREADEDAGAPPPESEGSEPPPEGSGVEDYEQMELPPFMTPVMEEMVRPPSDAPVKREAEQAEGQPEGTGDKKPPGEDAEAEQSDKAMNTTEAQRGQGSPEEIAQQASSEGDDEAPPGAADGRSDDAEGSGSDSPEQTGLGDVPHVEPEAVEEDLGEQVFHYDEWDHKIEDYRPAWCTLTEHRQTRTQEGFVAATFHEFGGIVTQIRRNFQLMRPEALRKMRYMEDGDDLDTDGLVEYVVDRKARVSPTPRVYIKREKRDRDVTTAFLVDMSSSTDRKIDGRKRIIDIEKEALLLMCEALEAIRDEYAIYGFSGSGREDAEFYVVKELGERYDDRVKDRIGGIYARQKTRMGPAIRHATRRLAGADSNVKLMILLTDGKPYDSDTYQDNTYAQEDTKMALREARREKIHLFCVTVDREGADYLPHMYSDANFIVVDDIRTLPQKLPQLYRRLTT